MTDTAAEQAFTAWWRYPDARLGPEAANRRGFLAGHASRDAEVAALREALQVAKGALGNIAHETGSGYYAHALDAVSSALGESAPPGDAP